MKRILVIIALCSPLLMQAQSIEHILKSIEQNNKELKAQKHAADATKMENRTNNNLPDPTVSYSSFYSNGAEGGHGTEFVASQGFDFPTQYIARNRQATLQNEAVDKQQQAARRDILLNAKNLCLDLILLNQEKTLMDIRMKNADELQALYEKRLTTGDANILEVNKIKMERMNVQTEVAQNSAAHLRGAAGRGAGARAAVPHRHRAAHEPRQHEHQQPRLAADGGVRARALRCV